MADNYPYEDEDEGAPTSNPIQDARAQIDALEKDNKALRKAAEAAEKRAQELEVTRRADQAKAAFEALNLDPVQADLYLGKTEGEVTKESVTAFAQTYKLLPPAAEPEPEAEPTPEPFVPVAGTNAPPQTMTMDEWKKFYVANPVAALQAFEQGRVLTPQ